jgi:hypothetical protein
VPQALLLSLQRQDCDLISNVEGVVVVVVVVAVVV